MERVFETISFDAPDSSDKKNHDRCEYVKERLADV